MANENWPTILLSAGGAILAAGGAVTGVVYAFGWAIPHIETASAQAINVIMSPHTLAVPIAGWVAPLASIGVAGTGGSAVIFVLVKAGERAAKEPAEWTVPLLAIIGAFLLDLAKDFGFENGFLKAAFVLVIAFLVVIAGACWKTKDWKLRGLSLFLLILPPFAVLIQSMRARGTGRLMEEIARVEPTVWIRLGGFVVIGIVSAAVYAIYGKSSSAPGGH
jgi:hypothetical protein